MNIPENYKDTNKDAWNKRTDVHVTSEFYDLPAFINGKSSLNATESALLGDVKAKKILHLQCHFGQDTLSLARMGAIITGMDLSDKSIEQARKLNTQLELDATFVCCDVYDLPQHLSDHFDIVYTSYGTIGWLPDLDKWAAVIQHFLKPGGKFVFVEFHPVVWMFDNHFDKIAYSYFNKETIIDETTGTYTNREAAIYYTEVSWNHSLAEVIGALLKNGITLTDFKEYDFSHYNCFENLEETAPSVFQLKHLQDKIPMMYSIVGIKN